MPCARSATDGAPVAGHARSRPDADADRDRRRAGPAGTGQHPDQRAPCRARAADAPPARPRSIRLIDDAHGRRPRRDRGPRPGHRHCARGPRARLRSLLHDAPYRHRPRPGDFAEHHRRTGRHDYRVEPARSGHGRAHRAARVRARGKRQRPSGSGSAMDPSGKPLADSWNR